MVGHLIPMYQYKIRINTEREIEVQAHNKIQLDIVEKYISLVPVADDSFHIKKHFANIYKDLKTVPYYNSVQLF